jgi:hypothetical protein
MNGTFGRVERASNSIGLAVAGVFSGQFAAVLRPAGTFSTPWDDTPLQAMCSQGSVLMLKIGTQGMAETRFDHLDEVVRREHDFLYVHRRYLDELRRRVPVVLL